MGDPDGAAGGRSSGMDDGHFFDETSRPNYRACWLGFSAYALNYLVTTVVFGLEVGLLFTGNNPNLGRHLGIDDFDFRFDSVRVWLRLLTCLILAGAWPGNPAWRRRAGLLATMAIGDIVLWAIIDAVPLGFSDKPSPHLVLCTYLRTVLSWSKFALLAGLATEFARHAGSPHAEGFGRATTRTAVAGAALWFFYFLARIDWSQPWPLAEHPFGPVSAQLWLVSLLALMTALVQASFLTVLSASAAMRMIREAREADPWAT